ncbi:hypothetical protein D3C75_1219770 [compost metagenome]
MYFRSWLQLCRNTETAMKSFSLYKYPVPSRDISHSIPSSEGIGTLAPLSKSSFASAVSSNAR